MSEFSSGLEIIWDEHELGAMVDRSLAEAAAHHAKAAKYVIELTFCQRSGGHDARAQIVHYFGAIKIFERGTSIHQELGNKKTLVGTDAMCAWCAQIVDHGTKDRHQRCGAVVDHEFMHGQMGYCPRCQRKGKIGEQIFDMLTFSYQGVRPLADLLWTLISQADPAKGTDLRMHRFLGDLYGPTELVRGKDISIREYLKKAETALKKESVVYEAEQFMRLRETGANPISAIEAMLRA